MEGLRDGARAEIERLAGQVVAVACELGAVSTGEVRHLRSAIVAVLVDLVPAGLERVEVGIVEGALEVDFVVSSPAQDREAVIYAARSEPPTPRPWSERDQKGARPTERAARTLHASHILGGSSAKGTVLV